MLYNKSVGCLITAETNSSSAFDDLYRYLCKKAEAIESEHIVSKQVVSGLLSAQRAIENRARYNAEARSHLSMANKFSMLLDLIARGEAPVTGNQEYPELFNAESLVLARPTI